MEEKKKRTLTVLTNSEIGTFLDCPKKHGFVYSEGLRPMTTPRALTFGQAFHSGVESLYRLVGTVAPDEVEQRAREQGSAAIRARFKTWVDECEADPNAKIDSLYEDAKEQLDTATWMLDHYITTFRNDIRRIVPLGVEMAFSVPLRNSIGRVMPHYAYDGVLDLVYFDPEYGDIVIADHKSTSGPVDSVDKRVEMDPQMEGYLNALVEMMRDSRGQFVAEAHHRNMHPRYLEAVEAIESKTATLGRVAYNVVRKKRPSVPKVNLDGKVSVAAIDTLAEVFDAALQEQALVRGIPVSEKQRELAETIRAKGDSFIGRREFFKNARDIEAWRAQTFEKARLIRAAEANPSLRFRNPGNCSMPWSMPCSYRSVCLDDSPEIRASFRTDTRHTEVEEARKRAKLENLEE